MEITIFDSKSMSDVPIAEPLEIINFHVGSARYSVKIIEAGIRVHVLDEALGAKTTIEMPASNVIVVRSTKDL